ncbi:restriction endonuclease subunit S [Bacillus subtilis]|uniref:restriction endonuclease subunit S n=1 Tax=Bacillus subtilis TaxID=1423 RepID=UPI00089E05FA|nr:restriction endonuclease subunit S [Bacillus subtilis]AOY05581.1 hypothetical protein BKN48_09595 [Bacillus subtilis]
MDFVEIPRTVTFNQLKDKKSLSAANYKRVILRNSNVKMLRELVELPVKGGKEVGSKEYIEKSHKYFIRTKAFQPHSILLDLKRGTYLPIRPQAFANHQLKEGDVLILKDSNVGEVVYLDKDYPNHMLSGGIKKLDIPKNKLYILAFLKSEFYKNQLDFLIGKGATIRHAKDKYLDCYVPFPNGDNSQKVIEYVSLLMNSVIKKEASIKYKHNKIKNLIEEELIQGDVYSGALNPTYGDLKNNSRIDAGFYSQDFKRINHYIRNYPKGSKTIYELGYELSRGQNLQISAIGKSLQRNTYHPNYYKVFLPTNISEYGTIRKVIYLGNSNDLKCLVKGDLVIGAEGFEKGRSIVITGDTSNVITNIHGIILKSTSNDLEQSLFVKCFLDYLRSQGIIDKFAVGGNGGSLAMKYWKEIRFPLFEQDLKRKISNLYYNTEGLQEVNFQSNQINLANFGEVDDKITSISGVIELDEQIKELKARINEVILSVCLDEKVNISFDFNYTN